jgi:hypothetical protein
MTPERMIYTLRYSREQDHWALTFMDAKGQYEYPVKFCKEPTRGDVLAFLEADAMERIRRFVAPEENR